MSRLLSVEGVCEISLSDWLCGNHAGRRILSDPHNYAGEIHTEMVNMVQGVDLYIFL